MRVLTTLLVLLVCGCSVDKEILSGTLQGAIEGEEVVLDNVIACAASNLFNSRTSVFLYPRPGATNIRYFETRTPEADKNEFSEYEELEVATQDVFNGYLKKIETRAPEGRWIIVSFEEDGMVHLSNPIRVKKDSKPTEYLPENVSVENMGTTIPVFTWLDGAYDDSIIYFQVVSDENNDLFSGTYTQEKIFEYYDTANVVLNITRDPPPLLEFSTGYNFTLMGVSEDNWVNLFVELPFVLGEN